ncbi:unnamed protein product, partial [Gongylonema pulchrum]|uniref:EGF-like domain-containing protein n=1 Tax=Gongylonema pulchrum TaxID=637853 RepID=A0A183DB52_9BILA
QDGEEQPDEVKPQGASGCREHQDCHQWGECVFGRNGEPGYCRCRGWYVGDGVRHCGPPGETEIKQVVIEDAGAGHVGQTCGDYRCHINADCDTSSGHHVDFQIRLGVSRVSYLLDYPQWI